VQRIDSKLKNVRRGLKLWPKNMSSMKRLISDINIVIEFMDVLEEFRALFELELDFRDIIKKHVL
jgi:hypothetical protein